MDRRRLLALARVLWIGAVVGLIPATPAQPVSDEPGESRPVGKAWLGVWLGDAVDGGVQIVALVAGGPAQRAGLQTGDIILEANARPTPERTVVTQVLGSLTAGDSIELVLSRAGRVVAQTVRLEARGSRPTAPGAGLAARWPRPPRAAPARIGRERIGSRVAEMTPALRKHYGAPPDAGVLVTAVDAGGALGTAGVEVGDVLVEIGGRKLLDPRQLERALSEWNGREELGARIVRAGETHNVTLRARGLEQEIRELERRIERLRRELRELRQQR